MHQREALLSVAVVLVLLPWLLWNLSLVRRVAPLAVVQILVGVALGPSLLGRLAPEWHGQIFNPGVLGSLQGIATIGVVLYVFVAGMHLDPGSLKRDAGRLMLPTIGSFGLPLLLGIGWGFWLADAMPGVLGQRGNSLTFALAMGACIACTALPVLAAILREANWTETRLGQTALAMAAINDAALWLLLALVLAVTAGNAADAAGTLLLVAAWAGGMILLVRPALAWLARNQASPHRMLVVGAATALGSAAAAEAVGVGYIIGGFAAGLAMPPACRQPVLRSLEPVAAGVLLPFFFMVTGLRAMIEPDSPTFLAILVTACLATMLSKVVGVALPARATGERWSQAMALGALMQAKGLMEVVVLAVLLDAGLIGQQVYSALVGMAIVCTVVAAPLARLALRAGRQATGMATRTAQPR